MIIKKIVGLRKLLFARKSIVNTKEKWDRFLHNDHSKTITHTTSLEKFIADHCDVANVISKNTEITCNHMTPELKLFLLTDKCPLYYESFSDENEKFDFLTKNVFQDPFWSIYWPGGQVLTRFIFDERENILRYAMQDTRKRVLKILDLGAGCGATAIAAKLVTGPCKIVANDINKVACIAIAMNAMLNNVDIEITWKNLLEESQSNLEDPYDVVFIGDLLYDEEIANSLIAWLENAYLRGTRIYVGDPGRHALTEDFKKRMKLLRRYYLPEEVRKENHGYDTATVWEFSRP